MIRPREPLRRALRSARRWASRLLRGVRDDAVWFQPEDIDHLRDTFYASVSGQGPEWGPYRHAHMVLPAWFQQGLDPWGEAYRDQQLRLWRLITGVTRAYEPAADEVEAPWGDNDAVRLPGYYQRRDDGAVASAADHWLATGMLLKHSGLQSGDRALEYGAGFGQTALALARLGVHVDTVDISATFCRYVQQQADFFRVPLRAHQGLFGLHPPPGEPYKLIWFYESFHHCLDFQDLVPKLARMLAPGGLVILSGEPIFEAEYAAVPYPWGVRLHSEVAAVMRQTHWMELGFSEAFVFELFKRSGFSGRRIDCEASRFGQLYVFEPPPRRRPENAAQRWDFSAGELHFSVGQQVGSAVCTDGRGGYLCFGPYVHRPAGGWWAEVKLDPAVVPRGAIRVDLSSNLGQRVHAQKTFDLSGNTTTLWLPFTLSEDVSDLEVRVRCASDCSLRLLSVGLSPQEG